MSICISLLIIGILLLVIGMGGTFVLRLPLLGKVTLPLGAILIIVSVILDIFNLC